MRYWVIKGRPAQYDLDENVRSRSLDRWRTKKPPQDWSPGDRIFFWSSSPRRELVALGTFIGLDGEPSRDGTQFYHVRYRTGPLVGRVNAVELRADRVCADANFLKPAVAQGVLQVSAVEAYQMYRLLRRAGGGAPNCWHDIPDADGAPLNDIEVSVEEGGAKLRIHFSRERSPALARLKKQDVQRKKGKLACQVCSFEFATRYGRIGSGFCEVHHLRPLSALNQSTVTKLSDLAVVCANCHRMLHKGNPIFTLKQLKQRLADA